MRELVEHIVKQIVDDPDKVEVKQIGSGGAVVLEISTAKEDLGKIIGKKGRIVNALRVIVGAAAGQRGKKAEVEILEK
ncbi:RNA-binding protein [Candidatus Aerophobetes bacterium]|uniref:RNA-binding protein KhpA n=1 Tax=Aerophobetes bacterium TaxID=2030807 RepID=A0A497E1D2_UNCAE|nr:MAG: RNA-binding protein [Candidatus Aerophobetes bacterium]RLE11955.1 MAG: RNA-binding protein [Candidatus Aerophobetes bacterium]